MVGSLLAWSPVAVFAELEKLAIAHGGGTRRRRRQERRVGSTGEAGKWSRWEAAGGGPAERPAAAKAIGLVWLANQDGTHTGGCGIACAPMGAWWQRVGGALATAVTHERDGEVDRRFRRRQRPPGGGPEFLSKRVGRFLQAVSSTGRVWFYLRPNGFRRSAPRPEPSAPSGPVSLGSTNTTGYQQCARPLDWLRCK